MYHGTNTSEVGVVMITRSRKKWAYGYGRVSGSDMMATGGEEVLGSNMAFEAFRKHYEELLTAIQEPEVLAAGLYSRGVVTMSLMEKVGRGHVGRLRRLLGSYS